MGNSLIFNGINTADYGIIISGGGTYATPERDITSISVPGRNGDLHIDNGRFKNIQITYQAGIAKGFETRFLPFIRAMKAAPLYSRLVDSYHPDEYRMATFVPELVPDVGTILRSGHFELVFDCKPQRFLAAGEIPIEFDDSALSPQTIYKYTDFSTYFKENDLVAVANRTGLDVSALNYYIIDTDDITIAENDKIYIECDTENFFVSMGSYNPLTATGNISTLRVSKEFLHPLAHLRYWTVQAAANIKIYVNGELAYESPNLEHVPVYNQTLFKSKPLVKMEIASSLTAEETYLFAVDSAGVFMQRPDESPYNLAQTITVDCETMEAYSLPEDNTVGYFINWNPCVSFMTAPELIPGANDVAYDSTVSNLRIIPRWWTI